MSQITAKGIAEAAHQGHPDAIEVYDMCGEVLGQGLAILIDILNPEKIVLGSVYARSSDLLKKSMEKVLEYECLPYALEKCKILPAELGESLGDVAAISVAINGMAGRR